MLVEFADASVRDAFFYPPVPVHVVVRVELYAPCLHRNYWIRCWRLSGEYVKVVWVCYVLLALLFY